MSDAHSGSDGVSHLDLDELHKIQQVWTQLLRICGVEMPDNISGPDAPSRFSSSSIQHLKGASPGVFRRGFMELCFVRAAGYVGTPLFTSTQIGC